MTMEVKTVKQKCRGVARRWKERYSGGKMDIDAIVDVAGEEDV